MATQRRQTEASQEEQMQARQYAVIAALVFTVVAIVQAARLIYAWPVVVGSTDIPMAVSWVAVFVTGMLAILGFTASRG
jgi:hypothetical protein